MLLNERASAPISSPLSMGTGWKEPSARDAVAPASRRSDRVMRTAISAVPPRAARTAATRATATARQVRSPSRVTSLLTRPRAAEAWSWDSLRAAWVMSVRRSRLATTRPAAAWPSVSRSLAARSRSPRVLSSRLLATIPRYSPKAAIAPRQPARSASLARNLPRRSSPCWMRRAS